MIGQDVGLDYLIPLALEQLEEYAFLEGDFYEGDLLVGVSRVNQEFWKRNADLRKRLDYIVKNNIGEIKARGLEGSLFKPARL